MKRVLHLVRGAPPPAEAVGPQDTVLDYDAILPDDLVALISEHDLVAVW